MDRRERLEEHDVREGLIAYLQGWQSQVWTALPGIVDAVNLSKMTVSVRPSIQARVRNQRGEYEWVDIPLLVDVPLVFQSAGGFSITFPVAAGDEALVIFASRCIDSWWQSGGAQPQADLRMHDLSDGFAIIGPRSQPRKLSPQPVSSALELRSDNRSTYISITNAGNVRVDAAGDVDVIADGAARVTAPTILLAGAVTVTGSLTVNGNAAITGTVTNGGTTIGNDHIHPGGTLPGGFTGTPT